MSDELQEKSTATILAELKELFGPPPVLSTENPEAYEQILLRLIECFMPVDFIEKTMMRHLADAIWDEKRYVRHKTLSIERKFRQRLVYQAERKKLLGQRKDARVRELAEKAGAGANELERMHELQDVAEGVVDELDDILKRTPEELDHAHALESGIGVQEQLDRLHNNARARNNDTLDQFERYREGLGRRLRNASDDIIDVECNEVEPQPQQVAAPPLVPPADGTQ